MLAPTIIKTTQKHNQQNVARFENRHLDRHGELFYIFIYEFAKKYRRPEYIGEIYMFKIFV